MAQDDSSGTHTMDGVAVGAHVAMDGARLVSVVIRQTQDGRDFECDWGRFDNAEANPLQHGGIRELILVIPEYWQELVDSGPETLHHGGTVSAATRDGNRFVRLDFQGQHWVWELHEAKWWDNADQPIMVGRWV